MNRPLFVVLEGIDGSGTTTQAERLKLNLEHRKHVVHATREPSKGPVGKFLRRMLSKEVEALDPFSMALLFTADRMDHMKREIVPALGRGEVAISDRYDLSSLIYQSETFAMPKSIFPWLVSLNARALRPDLKIVLDVSSETAHARRTGRGGPVELFEVPELQTRLAACYARAHDYVPNDALEILSGAGTPESVENEILETLVRRFPWLTE